MLLGENYYTDRTSKQTVDVLKRRDKTLQTQIHSLKAEIDDFQTEASFFTSTASEAAVGLLKEWIICLILCALVLLHSAYASYTVLLYFIGRTC